MQKLTLNSNYSSISSTSSFGSRSRSNSTATKTYFYFPWGLGWDQSNNRLIASDLNKGSVQIFDTSGTYRLISGGRYDKLLKSLGSDEQLCAVGFATYNNEINKYLESKSNGQN